MSLNKPEFEELLQKVAEILELSPEAITQDKVKNKVPKLVDARVILYMFLSDKHESATKIGLRFNQHRASVLYGLEAGRDWLRFDPKFKAKYEKCKAVIYGQD